MYIVYLIARSMRTICFTFYQICNFMTGDATALSGIDCDVSNLNLFWRLQLPTEVYNSLKNDMYYFDFSFITQKSMRDSWFNGLLAMEDTLVLERYVNEELLKIHSGHDDDAHVRPLFSLIETYFFHHFIH